MSQNNTIRKSDKKFIRKEKSRIRRQFSDVKKQEELIDEIYKKFLNQAEIKDITMKEKPKDNGKKDIKKETKEPKIRKEKIVKPQKHEK